MKTAAGYYRHPALHGERIAFVCENDVWCVPAGGGVARRLTAGRGRADLPVFSPDGRQLAYTGREDGPAEVFVMPADGGPAQRLTWTEGWVRTEGWSPDGKRIIFQSNHGEPFLGAFRLYSVDARGGPARRLDEFGLARELAREPGGKRVVLGINSGDPARWKRYRGGTAGTLWIDRDGSGEFEPLIRLAGNLAGPMWIGRRIYFLSDHEGHGNLYSCTPAGRGLKRHTHHEDFYVRYPDTDGKRIVYQAGADLWLFDVRSGESGRVPIELHSQRTQRARRFVSAGEYLEEVRLHPAGHSLVCTARGGAFTMPLWEGAPRRHGPISSARMRLVRYLPDGKRLVGVSDEKGEEGLVVFRADGEGRPRHLKRFDYGRVIDLEPAPAGAGRVALTNHRQEVWIVDLKTGAGRQLERSRFDRIHGIAWSPDGRWLAYGFSPSLRSTCLHLHDTKRGGIHAITRPEFHDYAPAFDPEGRYLYFLSDRVFDPVYDQQYFELGFPRGVLPCLIPLQAGLVSPFDPATREPKPVGANGQPGKPDGKDKDKGKGKRRAPAPVAIDLKGIADRVVAFPVSEGRYTAIAGAKGRVFFTTLPIEGSLGQTWADSGPPPARAHLEAFDLERNRKDSLIDGVTGFSLSMDASALLVRVGDRLRVLAAAVDPKEIVSKTEPGRETGWLDLGRLRLAVEPGEEWRQMFREAWRLQRDQFWASDMSAVDWKAVHDRYLPLVDRVASRIEFSDLMWEMQGELGTSHCYELGGDYLPSPRWHQGFLGADVEWLARERVWRIRRLPRGDSWDEASRSPLAAPGLNLREGDRILAVDGRRLDRTLSPHAALVHLAGREVVLSVKPGRGQRKRSRQVVVRTLRSEFPLRYRDWVERNRERVHRETKGRVGYLHIPDMGPRGFSEFHRAFRNELDREGLIVDVRWNGGGHVSQLLLTKLMRKRIGYDASRWQSPVPYPSEAPMGPMVALTNEYAGSDGDIFSHCFKRYGLGPLIGKRTWGGVVGIWPRHALVDGTITTQPEFAFWFDDVGYGVENYGTDPDIEVEFKPQDHAARRDPQLERGLAEIRRVLRELKPSIPRFGARPSRTPPKLPRR